MMNQLILIALGGAAGSVLRYLVSFYAPTIFGSNWLLTGTFLVNITGCFLIGFLAQWLEAKHLLESGLGMLILVGFLGGFTTFSAFGLEGFALLQQSALQAMLYSGIQVILGIGAVWAGFILCRWWLT